MNRDGNDLILHMNNNSLAQVFSLKMLPDTKFVLGWRDKCMIYNQRRNNFISGPCTNLEQSTFELYLETEPASKNVTDEVIVINNVPTSSHHSQSVASGRGHHIREKINERRSNRRPEAEGQRNIKTIFINNANDSLSTESSEANGIEIEHRAIGRKTKDGGDFAKKAFDLVRRHEHGTAESRGHSRHHRHVHGENSSSSSSEASSGTARKNAHGRHRHSLGVCRICGMKYDKEHPHHSNLKFA